MNLEELRSLSPQARNKAFKRLPYRDREVLKLRCGFGDGYTYTLKEVSHIFRVSPSTIRRIELRAIEAIARLDLNEYLQSDNSDAQAIQAESMFEEASAATAVDLLIDPGTAPPDEIAAFLSELSMLYKLVGGKGIDFQVSDSREPVMEEVHS